MKECFGCLTIKAIDEFYPHKEMSDGHLNKCKECIKADTKKRRTHPVLGERIRARDRRRGMLPHRVAARNKYQQTAAGVAAMRRGQDRWEKDNTEKKVAHNLVNNRVRSGEVVKPSHCQLCGSKQQRIEGHHQDYSRPLDVLWVCRVCHVGIHVGGKERAMGEHSVRKSEQQHVA